MTHAIFKKNFHHQHPEDLQSTGHVWFARKANKTILLIGTHHYLKNESVLKTFTRKLLRLSGSPNIVWQECINEFDDSMDYHIAKHFRDARSEALDDSFDDFLVNFTNSILQLCLDQNCDFEDSDSETKSFLTGNTMAERNEAEINCYIDWIVKYRNRKWMRKIGNQKEEIVIVGNDHLYFRDGLLYLLTNDNWTISQVNIEETIFNT